MISEDIGIGKMPTDESMVEKYKEKNQSFRMLDIIIYDIQEDLILRKLFITKLLLFLVI